VRRRRGRAALPTAAAHGTLCGRCDAACCVLVPRSFTHGAAAVRRRSADELVFWLREGGQPGQLAREAHASRRAHARLLRPTAGVWLPAARRSLVRALLLQRRSDRKSAGACAAQGRANLTRRRRPRRRRPHAALTLSGERHDPQNIGPRLPAAGTAAGYRSSSAPSSHLPLSPHHRKPLSLSFRASALASPPSPLHPTSFRSHTSGASSPCLPLSSLRPFPFLAISSGSFLIAVELAPAFLVRAESCLSTSHVLIGLAVGRSRRRL
jgi:hypothetical protein